MLSWIVCLPGASERLKGNLLFRSDERLGVLLAVYMSIRPKLLSQGPAAHKEAYGLRCTTWPRGRLWTGHWGRSWAVFVSAWLPSSGRRRDRAFVVKFPRVDTGRSSLAWRSLDF